MIKQLAEIKKQKLVKLITTDGVYIGYLDAVYTDGILLRIKNDYSLKYFKLNTLILIEEVL